jgi:hypothetical protein
LSCIPGHMELVKRFSYYPSHLAMMAMTMTR